MLLKNSFCAFVESLYPKGYVLAQADPEAAQRLRDSFVQKKQATAGGISFFYPEYAFEFLLSAAGQAGLPVQLIKKQLGGVVTGGYEKGFVFGSCLEAQTQEKIKNLLETSKGSVTLVLREKQETENATLQNSPAGGGEPEPTGAGESPAKPVQSSADESRH